MRKIKGFSLIEILVVLMLFSIIVTIGNSIYSFFIKKNYSLMNSVQTNLTIETFLNRILVDCENSDYIIKESDLEFKALQKNNENIKYKIEQNKVIRKYQNIESVFDIEIMKFEMTNNNKFAKNNDLIHEILIEYKIKNIEQLYKIEKKYDSQTLYLNERN